MKPHSAAIYRNRLLKLAKFLDRIKDSNFNYGQWIGQDWSGRSDLSSCYKSCGTTACALGWATSMRTFRRLGLRMVGTPGNYCEPALCGDESHNRPSKAARVIFGLTRAEVDYIFIPGGYMYDRLGPDWAATAHVVANHIRAFCKRKYNKLD